VMLNSYSGGGSGSVCVCVKAVSSIAYGCKKISFVVSGIILTLESDISC
jgi:hypothetical protein